MIDRGERLIAVVAIIFLLSLKSSYAQHYGDKFVIAPNNYLNDFSVDRIAQQVYADYYMGWILRIDFETMAVESTKYAGVAPAFGNKRRYVPHGQRGGMYLCALFTEDAVLTDKLIYLK